MADRNAMTSTLSESAMGVASGLRGSTDGGLYGGMVLSMEATAVGVRGEYGGAAGSTSSEEDVMVIVVVVVVVVVVGGGPWFGGGGGGLGESWEADGVIWRAGRDIGVWFCMGFMVDCGELGRQEVWKRFDAMDFKGACGAAALE